MPIAIDPITITNLACEHFPTGFAIGTASPRLSWRFDGGLKDWKQTSYEVRVTRGGSTSEHKVESEFSVLVPWPVEPLRSREQAVVEVRVTGTDGATSKWISLAVEAGLLNKEDWSAGFVSSQKQDADQPKQPFLVRKTFTVSTNTTARLYATALGLYEIKINGKVIGDHVLAPGWQSYKHRLSYQSFDVTEALEVGENVIEGTVGEGWYAGRIGPREGRRNMYGDRLGLLAQLEVDGEVVVKTDKEWSWSYGTIISSEIYNGEVYDSTVRSNEWLPVDTLSFPSLTPTSPQAPPVRRIDFVKAKEIITTPSGRTILDFGQNLVGWLKWNKGGPTGRAGQKVVIRHAEVLEREELGDRPLRASKATVEVTLGGDLEGYEPKFTFHGFRYADVEGWPGLQLSDLTAVVVHTDMERTGHFESSHKHINQLYSNIVWGMRSNFVSVPTDCPQRDERLGWTGDLQVFCPTAALTYDVSGMLAEWLQDLAFEQIIDEEGIPPWVVPNVFLPDRRAPLAVWADASVITPRDLHKAFGDVKVMEDQWESMTVWLEKGIPRSPCGLYDPKVHQLGDWLDPKAPPFSPAMGCTDTLLVADAYLVHVTEAIARISTVLGKVKEAERYTTQAKSLRIEWHKEYVTVNGRLMSDSQTGLALALHFNLAKDDAQVKQWTDRLDYLVRNANFKVSTGFAGTPIILPVLAKNNLLHLAYRMLQEPNCPSWLYPITMGATTMWERWDSMLPDGLINPGNMTSFNHYAFGAVYEFMFGTMGGVSLLEPGWKHSLISPQPGGTITNCKVDHMTPYGLIGCSWSIEGNEMSVSIEVPPNTTARVVLNGVDEVVGSGARKYSVPWEADARWPSKSIQLPCTRPNIEGFL